MVTHHGSCLNHSEATAAFFFMLESTAPSGFCHHLDEDQCVKILQYCRMKGLYFNLKEPATLKRAFLLISSE